MTDRSAEVDHNAAEGSATTGDVKANLATVTFASNRGDSKDLQRHGGARCPVELDPDVQLQGLVCVHPLKQAHLVCPGQAFAVRHDGVGKQNLISLIALRGPASRSDFEGAP